MRCTPATKSRKRRAIAEFWLLAGVYQLPDAGRRQRQFVRRGSERRERCGDRIGHQPADRDDAAFAGSFDPERIGRRRLVLEGDGANVWEIGRGGY